MRNMFKNIPWGSKIKILGGPPPPPPRGKKFSPKKGGIYYCILSAKELAQVPKLFQKGMFAPNLKTFGQKLRLLECGVYYIQGVPEVWDPLRNF